jgi:hypothetical protein
MTMVAIALCLTLRSVVGKYSGEVEARIGGWRVMHVN